MANGVINDHPWWNIVVHPGANTLEQLKEIVNVTNVGYVDTFTGLNIVLFLCHCGPDDPSLLEYVVSIGADFESDCGFLPPLHVAALRGKTKILRKLLDYGISPNQQDKHFMVPLQEAFLGDKNACVKVLVDAGADIINASPQWVLEFMAAREKVRVACIVVLGLLKTKSQSVGDRNGKDVLRMIGRCLWETRGHTKDMSCTSEM